MAAIRYYLGAENDERTNHVPQPNRWVRTGRLEAQGIITRGNERTGWRVRGRV
jgi:hypothetical protein